MKVQHAVGNAAAINALPVTPGKIYFAKDTKKIFFDTADGRIEINSDVVAQVANLLTAITTLNGDASVAGSVANIANAAAAREVARIVGSADENLDTLEEIAAWISSDEGGNAAAALATRVGNIETTLNGMSNHGAKIASIENTIENTMATQTWISTNYESKEALTTTLAGYVQSNTLESYATTTALAALEARVAALEPENTEPKQPANPEDNGEQQQP